MRPFRRFHLIPLSLLDVPSHSLPGRAAPSKIKAPILFVAAEYDQQCPADKVREAVAQSHDAKLSLHHNTHFDMYIGETLEVGCSAFLCPLAILANVLEKSVIVELSRTCWGTLLGTFPRQEMPSRNTRQYNQPCSRVKTTQIKL